MQDEVFRTSQVQRAKIGVRKHWLTTASQAVLCWKKVSRIVEESVPDAQDIGSTRDTGDVDRFVFYVWSEFDSEGKTVSDWRSAIED